MLVAFNHCNSIQVKDDEVVAVELLLTRPTRHKTSPGDREMGAVVKSSTISEANPALVHSTVPPE